MALNAVHIRGRDRSSSPPARMPRPVLGSSASHLSTDDDDRGWHLVRTGESLATSALHVKGRFVKATHVSDPPLRLLSSPKAADEHSVDPHENNQPITAPSEASASTLAQLYAQISEDLPSSHPLTTQRPKDIRAMNSSDHHRHQHHAQTRQRSQWFISRALTKDAPHAKSVNLSGHSQAADIN